MGTGHLFLRASVNDPENVCARIPARHRNEEIRVTHFFRTKHASERNQPVAGGCASHRCNVASRQLVGTRGDAPDVLRRQSISSIEFRFRLATLPKECWFLRAVVLRMPGRAPRCCRSWRKPLQLLKSPTLQRASARNDIAPRWHRHNGQVRSRNGGSRRAIEKAGQSRECRRRCFPMSIRSRRRLHKSGHSCVRPPLEPSISY